MGEAIEQRIRQSIEQLDAGEGISVIVYRPETKPLQIVAILHAKREAAEILAVCV